MNSIPKAVVFLFSPTFRGSFSVVHKAVALQDGTPNSKVAIKEIDTAPLSKRQLTDLALEVNILSQLRHNNIVKLFTVYRSNHRQFLVSLSQISCSQFHAHC